MAANSTVVAEEDSVIGDRNQEWAAIGISLDVILSHVTTTLRDTTTEIANVILETLAVLTEVRIAFRNERQLSN